MAQQSNLERISIEERADEFAKSPYKYNEENPYSESHPDAIADGDAKGKGTKTPMGHLTVPEKKGTYETSTMMGITVNTLTGGGLYDTDGTKGVQGAFQGDAGRKYLLGGVNLYNPSNEYGKDSVDTSNNIPGQYWVE